MNKEVSHIMDYINPPTFLKSSVKIQCVLINLGAGESGKSTIAKQMRIIYLEGFTDEERQHYKEIIYSNMIQSMTALLNATAKFDYELEAQNRV